MPLSICKLLTAYHEDRNPTTMHLHHGTVKFPDLMQFTAGFELQPPLSRRSTESLLIY